MAEFSIAISIYNGYMRLTVQITIQGGLYITTRKGKEIPKELKDLFKELDKLEGVEKVIPGEIKQKRGTSPPTVKVVRKMDSGLKLQVKKGGLVQEAFVTTKSPEYVAEKISQLKLK